MRMHPDNYYYCGTAFTVFLFSPVATLGVGRGTVYRSNLASRLLDVIQFVTFITSPPPSGDGLFFPPENIIYNIIYRYLYQLLLLHNKCIALFIIYLYTCGIRYVWVNRLNSTILYVAYLPYYIIIKFRFRYQRKLLTNAAAVNSCLPAAI